MRASLRESWVASVRAVLVDSATEKVSGVKVVLFGLERDLGSS
jgi:hypothetical protein